MLILSRKRGERVIVRTKHGDKIEVLVELIKGRSVRLGVAAPADVIVHREEIDRLEYPEDYREAV